MLTEAEAPMVKNREARHGENRSANPKAQVLGFAECWPRLVSPGSKRTNACSEESKLVQRLKRQ